MTRPGHNQRTDCMRTPKPKRVEIAVIRINTETDKWSCSAPRGLHAPLTRTIQRFCRPWLEDLQAVRTFIAAAPSGTRPPQATICIYGVVSLDGGFAAHKVEVDGFIIPDTTATAFCAALGIPWSFKC